MSTDYTIPKGEYRALVAERDRLREERREYQATIDSLVDECADHKAENAKLREQIAKARDPQRIGGTADPESFVYAIEQLREFRWQHATNDEEAIPYINNVADAHERENAKLREELEAVGIAAYSYGRGDLKTENAKLRELVKEAHLCMVNEGCCEDCYATQGECPIERDMRELGVDDGTE